MAGNATNLPGIIGPRLIFVQRPFCWAYFWVAYFRGGTFWLEIFVAKIDGAIFGWHFLSKLLRAIFGDYIFNQGKYCCTVIAEPLAPRTKRQWDCGFKVVALNCFASSMCAVKRRTDQESEEKFGKNRKLLNIGSSLLC